MIVTYLEMRAPYYRGAALPDGLRFAPMPADIDTYRTVFREVGTRWLWFGRLRLDDATLHSILSHPDVHLFTLIKDNTPAALLELDFREGRACELAYFGLSDALIGMGAGAFLMDRAVEQAFARPIERFHVHTCTLDSPQALGFYQRSGFQVLRQEVEVDDDPRLLGIHPFEAGPHVPILQP